MSAIMQLAHAVLLPDPNEVARLIPLANEEMRAFPEPLISGPALYEGTTFPIRYDHINGKTLSERGEGKPHSWGTFVWLCTLLSALAPMDLVTTDRYIAVRYTSKPKHNLFWIDIQKEGVLVGAKEFGAGRFRCRVGQFPGWSPDLKGIMIREKKITREIATILGVFRGT